MAVMRMGWMEASGTGGSLVEETGTVARHSGVVGSRKFDGAALADQRAAGTR